MTELDPKDMADLKPDDIVSFVIQECEYLNRFRHSEHGTAVSYEDRQAGRDGQAIMGKRDDPDPWMTSENLAPDQGKRDRRLASKAILAMNQIC